MPRLDTTLASNAASAYLPRVDSMAVHGVKYLVQQWAASLSNLGKWLGGRAPSPNLTPIVAPAPRNVSRMSEPAAGQVKPARLETLKCAETGREHPVLPREQCDTMISYRNGIGPSENPAGNRYRLEAAYPSGPLAGWRWGVYRRVATQPPRAVQP